MVLKPDGFYKGGAPKYPALTDAVAAAVEWKTDTTVGALMSNKATAVDRFNNVIYNTSPKMVGVSPAGKVLWQYPNEWVGVSGSHKAPLPETAW